MRRWRLSSTLLGAGATILVLAFLGIGAVLIMTSSFRSRLEQRTDETLLEQHIANRIQEGIYAQLVLARGAGNPGQAPERTEFYRLGARVHEAVREYLFQGLSNDERTQVERIEELHSELEVVAYGIFRLAADGALPAGAEALEGLVDRATRLSREVDRFTEMRLERHAEFKTQLSSGFRSLYLAMLAFGIALLGAFSGLFGLLRNRLLRPLAVLASAVRRLGAGDLDTRVAPHAQDELGAVAGSFNEMAASLKSARSGLERKNAELETTLSQLRSTQRDLVQSEKLNAMGRMLAGLAHELNNPLASVLGFGELLQAELADSTDPRVRSAAVELSAPLVAEARRARSLVRTLLDFTRQSGHDADAACDLGAVLRAAVRLRSYAFQQAGLTLLLESMADLRVRGDADRLQQVFLNLINNAFDSLNDRGTMLRIGAERTAEDRVTLVFEDDGSGMTAPESVFDPFYTTKPVGEGTGLGLTLVRRFIEDCGGRISCENRPDGGAMFTIDLILVEAEAAPSEGITPQVSAGHAGVAANGAAASAALPDRVAASVDHDGDVLRGRSVLVVEDEEPLRNLHERLLRKIGLRVLLAENGAEACEMLSAGSVDLVISDIKMPGEIDGLGLFEWLARNRPRLTERFIFVSGNLHEPHLAAMRAANPHRFLAKPFQTGDYFQRVREALQH